MYRMEAIGLGGISSRTNKADNYGLTGIGTLQPMWELACQRCAARAALDLENAEDLSACAWWPSCGLSTSDPGSPLAFGKDV